MSAYYRDERENRTYVRERSRSRSADRTPGFLREVRRPEPGPLVLRQRDVETMSRPRRQRSPSPVYVERQQVVRRARSVSPEPRRKERVVMYSSEKTGARAASPARRGRSVSRVRTRVMGRPRERSASSSSSSSSSASSYDSLSPPPRFVRRRSPEWKESQRETERIHTRIVRRSPSPSPSPPPPPPQPQVVRGPVIEREVITHYTDVDHGVVRARQPSPQPPPPRAKSRARAQETEIDIYTSRDETDIDIRRSSSRAHARSRSHSRHRPARDPYRESQPSLPSHDNDRLTVDYRKTRRRAHSAAPTPVREEAEWITSKIDSRGRMGEAYNGATREWTIVDVPPGTERIRMDGIGGGATETAYQRYTGVRRTRFIPERDGELVSVPDASASGRKSRDRLSIQITDDHREVDVKKSSDRRVVVRPQEPTMETWTEITMDLVNKEAVRRMGYPYEAREPFIYITQYLSSREIDHLVDLTVQIRRDRRLKQRQLRAGETDHTTDHVVIKTHKHRHRHHSPQHHHHHPHHPRPFAHEDGRYEKQVVFDRRRDFY